MKRLPGESFEDFKKRQADEFRRIRDNLRGKYVVPGYNLNDQKREKIMPAMSQKKLVERWLEKHEPKPLDCQGVPGDSEKGKTDRQ